MLRRLAVVLSATVLVLATATFPVDAQSQQRGVGIIHKLTNASPWVKKIACDGWTGICGCGPGRVDACWERTRQCCGCVACQ